MAKTKMQAGRVVAVYVDDGQGRRLVIANEHPSGYALDRPLVFALTQAEAKAAIAVLRQLAEELPP
jgi:hypothetical protein